MDPEVSHWEEMRRSITIASKNTISTMAIKHPMSPPPPRRRKKAMRKSCMKSKKGQKRKQKLVRFGPLPSSSLRGLFDALPSIK